MTVARGPRRPLFYMGVLSTGFVLGAFLNAFLRFVLPDGAPKQFFTTTVEPSFGPFGIDLLVIDFTVGPLILRVSLLAVVGVAIAYFVARSLF